MLELQIEKLGLMGQGVGYDMGRNIYFVPQALPGDRVRVKVTETKKRYKDATLLEILEPSSDRREPECPYFRECGGCDFLHLDYAAELKWKEAIVSHVLTRNGIVARKFLPICRSPKSFGYRNRIQLRQHRGKIGFFKRRSHEVIDIKKCMVADPVLNLEMDRLRSETNPWNKIEIALTEEGKVTRTFDLPHGSDGFAQVNSHQNEKLKETVVQFARLSKAQRLLELYCGSGNLTLPLSSSVESVVAVDGSARAIEKARLHPCANVQFQCSTIDSRLVKKLETSFREHYDTLVLDPPRQGTRVGLEPFLHNNLKSIIYVSCSPVSFSKDVRGLADRGFMLEIVQPIDMFPHTRQIEFVSLFLR